MLFSAIVPSTFLIIVAATVAVTVLISLAISTMVVSIAVAALRWATERKENPFKFRITNAQTKTKTHACQCATISRWLKGEGGGRMPNFMCAIFVD